MSKILSVFIKILAVLVLFGIIISLVLTYIAANRAAKELDASVSPYIEEKINTESVSYSEASAVHSATPTPDPTPVLTPEPTPQPTPVPTPEPSPEIFTISFIGDCTFASYPEIRNYGISFENTVKNDWAYCFKNCSDFFLSDEFTIANLECSLSDLIGYSNSTFSFLAPAAAVNILKYGGVDYVTTANNHSMDFGQTIYNDTVQTLTQSGIEFSGEGEACLAVTKNGLNIGIYSIFNYFSPTVEQVTAGISELKQRGADVIILAAHWGIEGNYYQTAEQEKVAHAAIDAGADIVYGCHPHRLQPMEEYKGKIILYSMANWCFGGNTLPSDMDTAIAQIFIKRDPDGVISIDGYEIIPCSISSRIDVNDYCPTPWEKGSAEYDRALSKISGTYSGANSNIDYSFMHEGEDQ